MDAKPLLDKDDVVEKFILMLSEDIFYFGDKVEKEKIINGCFELELGCLDLNYPNEDFIRAWKITPAKKNYPFAYINDETSEIVGYDNGIRYEPRY